MLPSKLTILLNQNDARALVELAQQEYRDPRAQAAILIRESLQRRGLLSPDKKNDSQEESIQDG